MSLKTDKIIAYIASPYKHKDKDVMRERFDAVMQATVQIMKAFEDIIPFSPVTYTRPLAENLDVIYFDWYTFDLEFLYRCDILLVLKLEGWENSYGVKLEIEEAKKKDIPVIYATPDNIVDVLGKEVTNGTLGEI